MRRRKQIRLKEYDYSSVGAYFVTMCTKDRKEMFGHIVNGEMIRNKSRNIAQTCWDDLPVHFGNIELDEFVVMPNHVHGIIIITDEPRRDVQLNIPAGNYYSRISPKSGSLGVIVRTYKAAVTKERRKHGNPEFTWQSGFYDHIIRNRKSFRRIQD